MIKHTITNAAEITVLKLIDNTYKTGGGPASVPGCVLESRKGPVFQAIEVKGSNWMSITGKPFPLKDGPRAEGLRHLDEAAKECEKVVMVRVVAEDYRVPSISFTDDDTEPTIASTHEYSDEIKAGLGVNFIVSMKNGCPAKGSELSFTWDAEKERGTIQFYELDRTQELQLVETLVFSLNPDDVDDMGRPAYIESVFSQQSKFLAVDASDEIDVTTLVDVVGAKFEGGTIGGKPTFEDYIKGWKIFTDMRVNVTEIFAAGCYDPLVIGYMREIADGRHCEARFDIPPYLDQAAAIAWQADAGIQSRQMSAYWSPYSATDPFYGVRGIWGASGAACAAKARGNANFSGAIPGIHYAPAGTKRGTLDRRSVKSLFPTDIIDRDNMYDSRINMILASDTGPGIYISDALTCHYEENYSRFNWVTAIDNYIAHRFIQAASFAKFEPDGLTLKVISRLMADIRGDLITSGAIVKPREPDYDGDDPMLVTIEQKEIDLWLVTWEYCPTGAARRIAGQPILVK